MRIVDGSDDQILQHADVVFRHDFRIDRDLLQMLMAVHGDGDHTAPSSGLHGQLGHLLLQALLHFLRLLHHVLDVHRAFAFQRSSTVVFSTGKISSTACTVELAIASAFTSSADGFGVSRRSSPGTSRAEADADDGAPVTSATAMVMGTGFPATFSASDCSQGFCSSHCAFAFF